MATALTSHFDLEEFEQSQMATRLGREVVVPSDYVPRLRALCVNILEPLRLDVRRSVWISSGYRPDWLNSAIGGAPDSQHVLAQAADINVSGLTPVQVCRRIIALGLPFDQLILEFDRWTHVSFSDRQRRSILTARRENGRVQYLPGIQETIA